VYKLIKLFCNNRPGKKEKKINKPQIITMCYSAVELKLELFVLITRFCRVWQRKYRKLHAATVKLYDIHYNYKLQPI